MIIKRIFDIIASGFGLLLLSPIFVVVSLWVCCDSPGGIFFRQERVGFAGKLFRIYKFRTMYVGSSEKGLLTVGNDNRVTKSGAFLRKYKLDELPQLFDVLRGKMSLVGPRPEVKEFIDEYSDEVRDKVLSIKPGITDLASIEMVDENQILSRYDDYRSAYIKEILPIKQRYYLEYVENQSLLLDVKIIFLTVFKIIYR